MRLAICAVLMFAPAAALAEGNPFVPNAKGLGPADVERIIDERIGSYVKKLEEKVKAQPSTAAPGAVPGMPPGAVVPGGQVSGAQVPGTYGAPGAVQTVAPPALEEARKAGDVRFIGCINGEPKFVRSKTGERFEFSNKDLAAAVKTGALPECRGGAK